MKRHVTNKGHAPPRLHPLLLMHLLRLVTCMSRSVGNPIRKLLFNPLESRDPTIANALAKRKDGGVTIALR